MNLEGLPEIFYKVTADYEMVKVRHDRNEDWCIIPPVPLIDKIKLRTPANCVALGEDLYRSINPAIHDEDHYKFESLDAFPIDYWNTGSYSLYLLSRSK